MRTTFLFRILAALGIAAFVMPKEGVLTFFLCVVTFLISFFLASQLKRKKFYVYSVILILLFVALLSSGLTPSLFSALVAAMGLAVVFPGFALVIVLLQTSLATTVELLFANWLYPYGLEIGATALLASLVMLAMSSRVSLVNITLPFLVLIATFFSTHWYDAPVLVMYASSLPVMLVASLLNPANKQNHIVSKYGKVFSFIFILVLCVVWILRPPTISNEQYFYLNEDTSQPEVTHFQNYKEALDYTDLNFQFAETLDSIPIGSQVILPWLSGLTPSELEKLKELAETLSWTVLLIGEHTNHSAIADRIEFLVGKRALRDDLVTPARNQDINGMLRVADIKAWPTRTIFNRGASVEISSLLDRALLLGDGWWAEPNLDEWLWVGDYQWQAGDRAGRLPLMGSFYNNGATWVVIGDSSPFLNQQLLADPLAIKRFSALATLLPTLIRDATLVICAIILFFASTKILSVLIIFIIIFGVISSFNYPITQRFWLSGFDERNINSALLEEPNLLTKGWKYRLLNDPLSGLNYQLEPKVVYFGVVDGSVHLGNISLDNCRRLGNLQTGEGPKLMDAQVCRVQGDAKVLIGDHQSAAAIEVPTTGSSAILVLDKKFIGRNAPIENASWLLNEVTRLPR